MAIVRRSDTGFPSILTDFFGDELFGKVSNMMTSQAQLPAVNIKENERQFTIELAAPGMSKDDLRVHVEDDRLTIEGENRHQAKEGGEGENFTRQEFSYSNFSRTFRLPKNVKGDEIKAKAENGVLHVTIPKGEEAPKRRQLELE